MGDISKWEIMPVIRFFRKIFPVESRGEEQTRAADKARALSGDFGPPVFKEPSVVAGSLNRGKLLIGTAIFYEDSNIDDEDIGLIAGGGFDFIINENTGEYQRMLADACGKFAIALISRDESLPNGSGILDALASGKDLFADYAVHPARVGDTAFDEPHARFFDAMGAYYRLYKKSFPDKFLFYNLFPAGTSAKKLGTKNYKEYIAEYVKKVPSDFISLDEYPFFSISLLKRMAFAICLHTYDTVAAACRENNRDFWLYLQTQGNWFDLIYALPTFEQIRWQAYAALAYGAKCLMHVAYSPVWGKHATAMIDKDGNITEQYLYAKQVNEELAALSSIYMRYKSLGVLPVIARKETGYMKTAMKRQRKSSAAKAFDGFDSVRSVTSDFSALAGYFTAAQGGSEALMLVNCANLYCPGAQQTVTAALRSPCKATIYRNGKPENTVIADKNITVLLTCGEGVFITLETC
jgi:hypothetical protein